MITKTDLERAYFHNIRNNQIGMYDGMSEEVAADLGFHTYEDTRGLINRFEERQSEDIQTNLGGLATKEEEPVIYCGEGCGPIPCAHANGRGTRGY